MISHRLYWSLQRASTKFFGVLDLYFFSIGYFLPPPSPLLIDGFFSSTYGTNTFFLLFPSFLVMFIHDVRGSCCTLFSAWHQKRWSLHDANLLMCQKKGRISPLWTVCCDALLNPTEIIMPMKKFSIHNKRKQIKWFVRLLMHTPGDRKNATARVWVKKGSGNVTVNEVPFVKYFPRMEDRYGICNQLFCRLH